MSRRCLFTRAAFRNPHLRRPMVKQDHGSPEEEVPGAIPSRAHDLICALLGRVIAANSRSSPAIPPIIHGDPPGLRDCGMGIEIEQVRANSMTIDCHPPVIIRGSGPGIFLSVGLIRKMAGFPHVIIIRICGRVCGRDGSNIRAILPVSQINRVVRTRNRGDFRHAGQLAAGHVGGARKRPSIDHITNELLLARVTRLPDPGSSDKRKSARW